MPQRHERASSIADDVESGAQGIQRRAVVSAVSDVTSRDCLIKQRLRWRSGSKKYDSHPRLFGGPKKSKVLPVCHVPVNQLRPLQLAKYMHIYYVGARGAPRKRAPAAASAALASPPRPRHPHPPLPVVHHWQHSRGGGGLGLRPLLGGRHAAVRRVCRAGQPLRDIDDAVHRPIDEAHSHLGGRHCAAVAGPDGEAAARRAPAGRCGDRDVASRPVAVGVQAGRRDAGRRRARPARAVGSQRRPEA